MKLSLNHSMVAILTMAVLFSIGQTASAAPSKEKPTPDLKGGGVDRDHGKAEAE